MFAVPVTRESRRVPVLLGGNGLARPLPVPRRIVPALLLPKPCSGRDDSHSDEPRSAGG